VTIEETHAEIAEHCGQISELFKPGARVTVLVRNPGIGQEGPYSADMTVGDDDLTEVIASLTYLKGMREVSL